ncbi:MAG: oxygenase MpaB family protein [Acidobacteriota bacterium]
MGSCPDGNEGSPVSRRQSEARIAAVVQRAAGERTGIFGPGSASWAVNRESAVFLGAGRAALLQLAHPWVAAALEQHSSVMERPIARFHNTFCVVYTMIFGALGQAAAAARHLYALHTRIQGELPQAVAAWPRGAHYQANDVAALRWVFATLVESAELAYACALGPMPVLLREQYYADSKRLAGLFGLDEAALPADWEAFAAYNLAMHRSGELGVSGGARRMAQGLLAGTGTWLPIPRWYRALTAEWLPERFRAEFGLAVNGNDRRAVERARRWIPGIYRRLPEAVRFVGPWHEAQARLAARRAGPVALVSNRFWIGRRNLPFAGASAVFESSGDCG